MYQWTPLSTFPGYAPVVAGWIFNQWVAKQDPNGYHKVLNKVLASTGSQPTPFMVLLLDGDELIAMAEVKPHPDSDDDPNRLWLDGVYVLPHYRGQGLAKDLVTQVLLHARRLQLDQLYLRTRHLEGGLYARVGFKPLQLSDEGDQQTLLMVAELR